MSAPPPDSARQPTRTDHARIDVVGDGVAGLATGLVLLASGHDIEIRPAETPDDPTRPASISGRVSAADPAGIAVDTTVRDFLARYTDADPDAITTNTAEYRYLAPDGAVESVFDAPTTFAATDTLAATLRSDVPGTNFETADDEPTDPRYARLDAATGSRPGTSDWPPDAQQMDDSPVDVVVAADGWLSGIRQRVLPDVTPDYAGYVSWHGTVAESAAPDDLVTWFEDAVTISRGDDELVAVTPLPGRDGDPERGERRLHWVWYDPIAARNLGSVLTASDGTNHETAVPAGDLQSRFTAMLHERAADHPPSIARLVRATTAPGVQPIVDVASPQSVVGRTALLGDAAFSPRQHTCAAVPKAIQDATALAAALDRYDDLDAALDDWAATQALHGRQLVEAGRQTDLDRLVGRV